ncbi:SURP and G-patch domain-containing protein 1 [Coemansia sp. RSA 2424]|nr:SURP and G-patch domain-containing protein 1 [Coemansia sp. RSA 2424]
MVKAVDGFHTPYSALRTADLESSKFLNSIAPGLVCYKDGNLTPPEITSNELAEALEHFDSGVRYIYKEGEFEDREHLSGSDKAAAVAIDKEGWGPGVLERVMWDRRKSSAERRQWKRAQDKRHCGNMVYSVSDISESSASDGESSSSGSSSSESDSAPSDASTDSDSDQSSNSSKSSVVARPTSINKALGSDNVGFKMLAKLGWQQGQGLGTSGNGIVEPIRLATRFSTVRGRGRGRGRQRGRGQARGVVRASLGTGCRPASQHLPPPAEEGHSADDFESYRKQMSSVYKNSSLRAQRHDDDSKFDRPS